MRAYTEQPALVFQLETLRDLIDEAASLAAESESGKAGPSIEIHSQPGVVVEVARARIVQAITNVLANAIESYQGIDSREPIEVRTEAQEGRIIITMKDSGCGMSQEAREDAITLFATSKPNGTGFGLPLAIKIVESEHGGRLDIESSKGRGTIVRIILRAQRLPDSA